MSSQNYPISKEIMGNCEQKSRDKPVAEKTEPNNFKLSCIDEFTYRILFYISVHLMEIHPT